MIPHDSTRTLQTSGLGETATFRIKPSGKAFRLLIDGLYSNKVRAVIRELWTNAYDSHVAAGRSADPFYCSLPTPLNPVFTVRDFGVGMSHETVMGLYSTIFESSKDSSNDQVGMMGLGSKSPFAYTDTFSVRAFDGIDQRHYMAVIGSDGVPQISLVSTTASTEPRGIEVSFPARNGDFGRFRSEAKDLLIGLDVKPSGLDEVQASDPLFGAGSWRVFQGVSDATVAVRQGCVVYPVDSSIGRRCGVPYGHTVVIDVPIGSVDVTGSRESLSLDDHTTAFLMERCTDVAHEITAHIVEAVNRCQSYVSATRTWWTTYRTFRSSGVTYRGTELNSHIDLTQFSDRLEASGVAGQTIALHRARPTKTNGAYVVHVPVDMIDQMLIIVDDGSKVQRKVMRLREAGKARRETFVADVQQAQRVAALLELAPRQLVPLASLPDPGPSAASRSPRTSIELPSTPFMWGIRNRTTHLFPALWTEGMKDDDTRYRAVVDALKAIGETRDVEYLTERQAKQLGLPEVDRIDNVLAVRIATVKPLIEAQQRQDRAHSTISRLTGSMPYGMTTEQRITVLRSVVGDGLVKDYSAKEIVPESVMIIARHLGLVGTSQPPANLSTIMSSIRDKFPLLFKSQQDIIDFYITNTIAEATK